MPVRLGGALVAEFVGTFAIVFVGIMSVLATGGNLLGIALAFGLTVAVMVTATMHTSGGHFNPAVTLGFLVTNKIKPTAAVAYIATQLVAAVVGSLMVYAVAGMNPTDVKPFGVTDFGQTVGKTDITWPVALLAEILATALLVFVIWGSAADPRARNTGGFAIGMAVVIDILAIGPFTGASMNPARSFGPSLAATILGASHNTGEAGWGHHWVYWVGPIVGGLLAAVAYHLILWPTDPRRGLDPDAVDVAVTQRP